MSVETTIPPDVVASKLQDAKDEKLNEEKDEGTNKNLEVEEQTCATSAATTSLEELSTANLELLNDEVEDSKLILPANDLIEDPQLLPSANNKDDHLSSPNDKVEEPVLLLLANDLVEDPQLLPLERNQNEDPLLSPPANDEAEDPLSSQSSSELVEDSLMLPSDRTMLPLLKDNLKDPLSMTSACDNVKDFQPLSSGSDHLEQSLSPLNDKGEEDNPLSLPITSDNLIFKDPLTLSSASGLVENSIWPLDSDQDEVPLTKPPGTKLVKVPLLLSPKDKVENPLSLPSASDHVDDTQPLLSESDAQSPLSSNDKVADSPSPPSESDLVEDRLLLPSTMDRDEVPSASDCPKDPLSPSNEDPLLIPSGEEDSEEPLHILSEHAYPRPMEIDNSIWSNLASTNDKLEDMKPCSPAQTNRKRNKNGEDSDSDSDVIFVEKNQEVIELSDDETNECADLLTNLNVPDQVVNCLKAASNKVSLQLGDLIKNRGCVNNIIVEIPTVSWSLPWVCVSGLFKNPTLKSKLKRSPVKSKISKRKSTEDIPKRKKSKVKETSIDDTEMKSTLCNIKKEKELYEDADRILSVIHFDPNKPPEFCEISRSGRLIKKPTRLQDDMTFFRRTRRRKKQDETTEEVDDPMPSEVRQEPSTSEDKQSETSEKSLENYSLDSESCDRWMMELNSDTENEEIDVGDVSDLPSMLPVPLETIEIMSDDGSDPSSINQSTIKSDESSVNQSSTKQSSIYKSYLKKVNDKLKKKYCDLKQNELKRTELKQNEHKQTEHNIAERKRRQYLRHCYCQLLEEVKSVRVDFTDRAPKISILNEAINCIKQLESNVKTSKISVREMTERNAFLFKKLTKMKKTLPK